ncbi:dephospho-CoA kinase [Allocatelliglobosispora scoriae]|uniref:Dephospho-CoA kinase n=1 Tax=Allocatelliglobosispora scoriae TaxID=643052 RepID=A0A841BLX6_9ACTN|nr:dephospho-CoA kinase [Allocatelliglobosispora scoriae]
MVWVGLTGGIGAGKSAVAKLLAERGAIIIDSDRLARAVIAPGTDGLAEVVAEFGTGVLGADGGVDRAALAAAVFGDTAARKRLEAIIHPRVRSRTVELATAAPPDSVVVNDVPLLIEAGLASTYELVIVVLAETETRVARVMRDRGMAEDEARARIAAQATDEQRRAAADILIDNNGTPEELAAQVDEVWTTLRARLS